MIHRVFHNSCRKWVARLQMWFILKFIFHMGKLAPIFPYKKYREFHIFVGLSGLRLPYMKHENFHMTYMKIYLKISTCEMRRFHISYSKMCSQISITWNIENYMFMSENLQIFAYEIYWIPYINIAEKSFPNHHFWNKHNSIFHLGKLLMWCPHAKHTKFTISHLKSYAFKTHANNFICEV